MKLKKVHRIFAQIPKEPEPQGIWKDMRQIGYWASSDPVGNDREFVILTGTRGMEQFQQVLEARVAAYNNSYELPPTMVRR